MPPRRNPRPPIAFRTLVVLAIAIPVLMVGALFFAACDSGVKAPSQKSATGGNDVAKSPAAERKSWAGTNPAPPFPNGLTWFNVAKPLALSDLAGKAVVLDFWTLGCINCQDIIPDLKRLEDEFGDALVVVGVHSGKYSTEHDDESIKEAIGRYGLRHAVVNDPDFSIWNSYGVNAWPTVVVIDPTGKVVGGHAGEGIYPLFQPILSSLVKEFDGKGQIDRKPVPVSFQNTATSTVLSYPSKVVVDQRRGLLYIGDAGHNRILVADLNGKLIKAIGSGKEGFADGGPQEASFRAPQGMTLSPDGSTLYVADTRNHAIRSVDTVSGEVTTIAGTGRQLSQLPSTSDPATKVSLAAPWDVVLVGRTLFITMAGIHQIWALNLDTDRVSVFAGTSREGIDDGPRAQATLAQPSGIVADSHYLYWVDPESSSLRRVLWSADTQGQVETIVGTGLFDYGEDDGVGKAAKFQHAQGVAIADGKLFVSDTYNHKLRIVDAGSFRVLTLAGSADRGWSDGPAEAAKFNEPGGLSVAGGIAYVADTNNHLIREVNVQSGVVSSLTLTNLAAISSGPAQEVKQALPAVSLAPGIGTLRVSIKAPQGYHLNSQAPSKLTVTASNPAIASIGESTLTWTTDDPTVTVPVAVDLRAGSANVTLLLSIYYCRTGAEALCFIHQAELTLPLTVATSSATHEAPVEYLLPPS